MSYISHCTSLGTAATDVGRLQLRCFDAFAGTTNSVVQIATYQIQALETFVWNDRFSFFGGEPANQGIMNDAATQLAIGVQNSSVVQTLEHGATDTAAIYDVHVTFIDQDWT